MPRLLRRSLVVLVLGIAGCAGAHSPLLPAGPSGAWNSIVNSGAAGALGFRSIYSFKASATDGKHPFGNLLLVKSTNGTLTLYGTTYSGGAHNAGTVFSLTKTEAGGFSEALVHSFGGGEDGKHPRAGLVAVDGTLYGTTNYGGSKGNGTVFKIVGGNESVIHNFGVRDGDGAQPVAELLAVPRDGAVWLYGTTYRGGSHGKGTVFKISTTGDEHVMHSFGEGHDGAYPTAGLSLSRSAHEFVGTTNYGGGAHVGGDGTVFAIGFDGAERVLYSFTFRHGDNGQYPLGGAVVGPSGSYFGTTSEGGPGCGLKGCGTVFRVSCGNASPTCFHSFPIGYGTIPKAGLILKAPILYGTTANGGPADKGAIFALLQGAFEGLHAFSGKDGAHPVASLADGGNALFGTTVDGGDNNEGTVFEFALSAPTPSPGPTATPTPTPPPQPPGVVYRFKQTGDEGNAPDTPLLHANGTLYGTTRVNGTGQCCGEVFELTRSGAHRTIYRFLGSAHHDGTTPEGGLTWYGGELWGTTAFGGTAGCEPNGCGIVYSLDPKTGVERLRGAFTSVNGAHPHGSLVFFRGLLFGTAAHGGDTTNCPHGCGVIFSIDPVTSKMSVVHRFSFAEGAMPFAGLTVVDHLLYGTTSGGGACARGGCGTVFELNPGHGDQLRVVYRFKGGPFDGDKPLSTLAFVDGRLWGTTNEGGEHLGAGGIRKGTVFAIDVKTGRETFLYSFKGNRDGERPAAGLILAGTTLYGTTVRGGAACVVFLGCGTVFSIDPKTGAESIVYAFQGSAKEDGAFPKADLIDVDDTLFGTTTSGGIRETDYHLNPCCGTVFQIALSAPSPSPSPSPSPTPTHSPTPTPSPSPTPTPTPGAFYTYAKSLHPLAYYRLDQTHGPAVGDSSGNGYTARAFGSVKFGVAGLLANDADKAIELTGGYVKLPDMKREAKFTLVTLVRASSLAAASPLVAYRGNYLAIAGGKLKWCSAFTGSCSDSFSPGLTGGKAYMLAVTATISSGIAVVNCSTNGAAFANCNRARFGSLALLSTGDFLGHGPLFSANFRGVLDESLIYPSVLTQAQVTKLAHLAGYP